MRHSGCEGYSKILNTKYHPFYVWTWDHNNNVSIWFAISLQFLIHKGKDKQEDESKTSYEK
jgi:hypothetical protein